jgi:O-antigen/teichoic acid export membrane protein
MSTTPLASAPEVPTQSPATPTSKLAKNILSNWTCYVFSIATNFFVAPFVVRHLGNEHYGVWTIVLSLTGYLGLLDLGVRGAVTRYTARYHAQGKHDRTNETTSAAMATFLLTSLVALLASIVLAMFVVQRLKMPAQDIFAARVVLLVTGVNVCVSLVNGVYGGVLVGLQRFDLTNTIEIINSAARALVIVLVLEMGRGIITLAFIQLLFTITRFCANFHYAHRLYPQLRVQPLRADRVNLTSVFSFSFFTFLLQVSGSLIYASDNVLIGAYLPVASVTFYAIGGNLVEYARTVVSGISQAISPLASSLQAKEDFAGLRRLVLRSSRLGIMVAVPIALTFVLRGSHFVGLWMGPQYSDLSGKVLAILAVTLLFTAGNSPTGGIMLGLGKHRPIVPALLIEGALNLCLSILLLKRIGVLGVALGTLIPSGLTSLFFWPWYVKRTLDISRITYITNAWFRPALALIPFALASYAVDRFWPAPNLLVFFLQVALCLVVALVGYWASCLDVEERVQIAEKVSRYFTLALSRS